MLAHGVLSGFDSHTRKAGMAGTVIEWARTEEPLQELCRRRLISLSWQFLDVRAL